MTTNNKSKTDFNEILIVDDEVANLKLLADFLGQHGYQVRPAEMPQLAIDSAMAQLTALENAKRSRKSHPDEIETNHSCVPKRRWKL